jgi:diguanylate cyclase (GGDEF)-like protein/PAS domain S-box-containing protein
MTGASLAVMTVSAMAAWGTALNRGPFSMSPQGEALLLLWAYITTLVAISLIITALLAESRKIAAELRLHSLILQNMIEGVQLTRASDSIIVYSNPNFEQMFGYAAGELIGQHVSKLNAPCNRSALEVAREIDEALRRQGYWAGEILNIRKDGSQMWCSVRISTFDHPELGLLWVAVHADITQRKQAEEQAQFLAFYDPLTELPNRRLLLERMKLLAEMGKRAEQHLGLIFLDLDHFKQLNDTLGHNAGDALLTEVAARLRKCVREGDTVARLGGDEFVILLPHLSADPQTADTDAMSIAEKIRYAVEQPYSLEGTPYDCTSSLGVDVSRQSALDVAEALKRADAAMYRAKGCGRNSIALTHDNAA